MNYIEFLHNRDKYLGENHDDFLMHYGILGQKWGQRHWQNPDGTYTTEGKIRYFGSKKAQAEINADETKIGSKTSDAKDYLKFRNKMLKERTRPDLNEWYRDKNKYLDKQLVRDAKRVDKQQQKMYKNQLKDWYDNPEDLVSDLNAMYKIGGKAEKNKDIPTVADKLYPNKKYELNDKDYNKFQEITYDISSKMVENATNNKGQKFRENQEKLEEELLKVPFVKKHFDEMKKIYQETGNWDKAEEHYWEIPDLAEQGDFLINTIQNHISDDQKIGSSSKEAKRLAKEAENLEKEFLTQSPYDKNYKYLDGDKIDKWLDKEENKAVEKAYADAMNTAFGDTSKELHELFKDYDDNPDKYVAKAAICDSLDWYDKLGDISSEVRWFIGDDGDQGSRNSHAYYLNTKGYDEKQIDKKFWEANEKLNEGYEVGKKLSQYYNPIILHMSEKLQKELYNRINYRWEKSDNYSYNKILEASEGGEFNKDHMKIADNFEKKLKPSCSDKNGDGWWYFNQAVRNLDMENVSYKDMTSSDWDKLNAEIERLKR